MTRILLALIVTIGLTALSSKAIAELDLDDRSAMMQLGDDLLRCAIIFKFLGLNAADDLQRVADDNNRRDYSIAVLHLYKLLKVVDEEALARRRWSAMFDQVKWAHDHNKLDRELKVCTRIEPQQRELMAHWRLQQEQINTKQ
jgi:hypothetical protein